MRNLKGVYIEWVDTVGDNDGSWKEANDTDVFFDNENNIVKQCGFVWREDRNYLCLIYQHLDTGEDILTSGRVMIPKKNVIKRVNLTFET